MVAIQWQRDDAAHEKHEAEIVALKAQISDLKAAIVALALTLETDRSERNRHPIRQLFGAFLAMPWQTQLAVVLTGVVLPLFITLLVATGQSPPVLAFDILQAAGACRTGKGAP